MLGFAFVWVVPDNQLNARWLKKEDRLLAVARVRNNQQGIGNKHLKWYQLKEALLDPMSWAFFFVALIGDIPNGGMTNFFNQLVGDSCHTPPPLAPVSFPAEDTYMDSFLTREGECRSPVLALARMKVCCSEYQEERSK